MEQIRISKAELNDPMVDDAINLQKSLQASTGEHIEDIPTPFYMNPIFYYSLAAVAGTFAAWAILEPHFNDDDGGITIPFVSDYILFGPVAGMLGLAIGIVYGIANHNLRKAFYCGIVGMGVGLGVTILTTFIAGIFFGITSQVAVALIQQQVPEGEFPLRGMSFFVFMCGRSIAWSVISMGAGLGLGIALKSKKLILNGFVGGMIGGLLGGLFFDPIHRFVTPGATDASVSRCVGIIAVGLLVGFFIGLFENISKDAWFLMVKGPLTGKQFIIFRSPLVIGSSPKADIYLFKDPNIIPKHATVTKSGNRYVLQDEGSESGVFVNGRKIDRYLLQPSDTITIGEAVLRYAEKPRDA